MSSLWFRSSTFACSVARFAAVQYRSPTSPGLENSGYSAALGTVSVQQAPSRGMRIPALQYPALPNESH